MIKFLKNLFSKNNSEAIIADLRGQLERYQIQLAACGAIASANTPESAKQARTGIHPDYLSGSLSDVMAAVDREMLNRSLLEVAEVSLKASIKHAEGLSQHCAAISAELGLPPFQAPAPGVLAAMVAENNRLRESQEPVMRQNHELGIALEAAEQKLADYEDMKAAFVLLADGIEGVTDCENATAGARHIIDKINQLVASLMDQRSAAKRLHRRTQAAESAGLRDVPDVPFPKGKPARKARKPYE